MEATNIYVSFNSLATTLVCKEPTTPVLPVSSFIFTSTFPSLPPPPPPPSIIIIIMGNCRVRLSDMIPVAWFYKLRNKSRNGIGGRNSVSAAAAQVDQQLSVENSKSLSPSSTSSSCPSSLYSRIPKQMRPPALKPGRASYYIPRTGSWGTESWTEDKLPCSPVNPKISDIKFLPEPRRKSTMKKRRQAQVCSAPGSGSVNEIDLVRVRPILSKKPVIADRKIEPDCGGSTGSARRRSFAGIQRLRARVNSPRIAAMKNKKTTTPPSKSKSRKSRHYSQMSSPADNVVSASFVIVKSSDDPQREFRESMVEMIVANDITSGKDLEELLACYLSLNSKEYHEVIVKVFRQIWFDLSNHRKH